MKWLGLTLVALLASAHGEAAEIKVLSTVGMQPATPELFSQFEAAAGHRVVVTYGLAAVLKTKFLEGAPGRRADPDGPHHRRPGEAGEGRAREQERCRAVRGRCGGESRRVQARYQHGRNVESRGPVGHVGRLFAGGRLGRGVRPGPRATRDRRPGPGEV